MKIAFDENIPIAMVRVFETFANERRLQSFVKNLEIKSAADYTPKPGDPDFVKRSDVPWIKRFAADGGKVVISGNTKMKQVPHERLALVDERMIVIFFENRWSNWDFCRKCALLLHWWPVIAAKIRTAKPGTFWHIPSAWPEQKARLRKVSAHDQKKLKIEKQLKARQNVRKLRKKEAAPIEIEFVESPQKSFDFQPPKKPSLRARDKEK